MLTFVTTHRSSSSHPLEILYQDSHWVVANKPSGLLVHRSNESSDTVFLLQELRNQLGTHVFPVHRLDRPASGAIALGLSSEAAATLQQALQSPSARKEYLALARGKTPAQGMIDRALKNDERTELLPSVTHFQTLFSTEEASLVRVWIETGRRHQIRRHFNHLGHQLIGDTVYGKGGVNRRFRELYDLNRLFLHCHSLALDHPFGAPRLEIHCPLPSELREVLKRLPGAPLPVIDTL